ncbi:hypothetical protein DevBK_06120 [Devosia sp. BK]|uniref:hypothetical protein n=1 Tax=Devosia sp. BK TaxID=2871706 RepID=UPI00293A516A|nr:hypothetical protein [Devosia sp. BK]MDV3250904.1 hypothetical protein [Devosia sp. BK]
MASTSILLVAIKNSAHPRAKSRQPANQITRLGALRGECVENNRARTSHVLRTGKFGHGREKGRSKTAIVFFDRVALCPPAGHMTSSYWAVNLKTVRHRPIPKESKFVIEGAENRRFQTGHVLVWHKEPDGFRSGATRPPRVGRWRSRNTCAFI